MIEFGDDFSFNPFEVETLELDFGKTLNEYLVVVRMKSGRKYARSFDSKTDAKEERKYLSEMMDTYTNPLKK